jgi:hypothetical protein
LPERLTAQAEVYRVAAQACANVPACKRFTVWGVSIAVSCSVMRASRSPASPIDMRREAGRRRPAGPAIACAG